MVLLEQTVGEYLEFLFCMSCQFGPFPALLNWNSGVTVVADFDCKRRCFHNLNMAFAVETYQLRRPPAH